MINNNPFPEDYNDLFPPLKPRKKDVAPVYQHFYAVRLVLHKPKEHIDTWIDVANELGISFTELKQQFINQINHLNSVKSKVNRNFHIKSFEEHNPFIVLELSSEEEMSIRSIANTLGKLSEALYYDYDWKKTGIKESRQFHVDIVDLTPQKEQ